MKIVHQDDGDFRAGMTLHLEAAIEEFGRTTIEAFTPDRSELLTVDEDQTIVDEDGRKSFHRLAHCLHSPQGEEKMTHYYPCPSLEEVLLLEMKGIISNFGI